MTDQELAALLKEPESDRIERKRSVSHPEKIREVICAFSNDLPRHGKPGVIFIGLNDDGSCAGVQVNDKLLRDLGAMRGDGRILPPPMMTVEKRVLEGCELAVIIVHPSKAPPVRFDGRVCIRIGPRRDFATTEEEKRLSEKRRAGDLPFDLSTVSSASMDDLDLDLAREYLGRAIAPEILERNVRSWNDRLRATRFLSPDDEPTVLGILVLGKEPTYHLPGAYAQFLRLDGEDLTDAIRDQKRIDGPLSQVLRRLDEVLEAHNTVATSITSGPVEIQRPEYPLPALQQIARNAVLHRLYDGTNSPVRISWFADRVEIQNPGGPFGQVTRENFGKPGITDYRNPHLGEAMRVLGYVQRFGMGIPLAMQEMEKNGNPPIEFTVERSHVLATLRRSRS